jgi:hypothetical protein
MPSMSVLYLDHFELNADPFRITPDIDFFFSGGRRGDILEGLVVAALHDEGIEFHPLPVLPDDRN